MTAWRILPTQFGEQNQGLHNYRNVWRGRKVLEDYLYDFICKWIGIYNNI